MKDSGEPSWHPNVYNLATSIADAYVEATAEPVILSSDKEALWHALVSRVAELLVAGHTHGEVGSQVGGTIEEWESKHRPGQGPYRFIVTSPREVAVAP